MIDPSLFIGSGKARELADLAAPSDIDAVVFDNPLSPAQQRNLQKLFECDVVDREALILDIFAQHAPSRIGAIQVELALLRYNLPRLRGKGASLSQQTGGIGAHRGPGETKLETDRRRIEQRITRLERDLKDVNRHAGDPVQGADSLRTPNCFPRRIHQRRQVDAAQPADRGRSPGRGSAVLYPRLDGSQVPPPERTEHSLVRHGRDSSAASPTIWSRLFVRHSTR